MCDEPDLQSIIEAYAPFRAVIRKLNYRVWISRTLVLAILELWGSGCIRPISLRPENYYRRRGIHGYAQRVLPPRFEISPFYFPC